MRRGDWWPAVLPLLLALAGSAGSFDKGQAAEAQSFIVAATDGYGVEDCLAEGGECGRIVADAWCESHGRGAAISFGLAEDVTGAIAISSAGVERPHGPYVIRCGP
jgi:hypothetical protein